ncbi:MAG: DUF2442 domain-containing protein [Bacteroidota bacterium]
MKRFAKLIRIVSVKVIKDFRVQLEFTNGECKDIDLEQYFHGPVFDELKSVPKLFKTIKVDKRMGTIVWDNGADIDPDVLYYGLTPAWMSEESTSSSQLYLVKEESPRYRPALKINRKK